MFSVYRKEIAGYFNSWTAYLVIGLFLLLNGLINWVFFDTSILRKGYASMDTFFELSPFLLLLLIPSITMRSLAGEKAEGTLEWLQTRPIGTSDIIFGKFFGGLTIFFLALLPTVVYVYSLYRLALSTGNFDGGSILGSYIGLLLFAGGFVAIGLFASAICKQVIPAFLLAFCLCLCFYLGFEAFSRLLQENSLALNVKQLGISYHFDVLARGVLDSRSLIYLLSLILLFLFLANRVLLKSILGKMRAKSLIFQSFVVLTALLAINYASNHWYARLDLTQDKRYSLSPITKSTLQNIPGDLQITVLLDGNLPPAFQQLRNSVRDLLTDMHSSGSGKLRIGFLNPLKGNTEQVQSRMAALSELHINPINLTVRKSDGSFNQQMVFPVAIVSDGIQEQVVHLLQASSEDSPENTVNHSIENLEYAFVSAFRKIARNEGKPIIGFTEDHGELNDADLQDAIYTLSLNNQVGRIDLKAIDFDGLKKLDVLILAKPTQAFSEAAKYKLDYFLQNGGNLIVSLDQLNGSLDSLRGSENAAQVLLARSLHLDDLLFNYGIRFNYDVLADLQSMQIPMQSGSGGSGAGSQHQIQLMPWPLHPLIVPVSSHPIVKNLGNLMTEYVGSLDTIALPGVTKNVLLHSSPFVQTLQSPAAISLSIMQQLPAPEAFKTEAKVVAVLQEGIFPSAFRYRMPPEGISHAPSMPEIGLPARLFAISDGDVFKNQYNPADGSAYPLGWDRYTQQQFSNKNLLLNLIDFMTDDPAVIALRGKEIKLRLLDRIKVAEQQFLWQFINVGLPIFILLLAGAAQYFLRRKRYSQSRV